MFADDDLEGQFKQKKRFSVENIDAKKETLKILITKQSLLYESKEINQYVIYTIFTKHCVT